MLARELFDVWNILVPFIIWAVAADNNEVLWNKTLIYDNTRYGVTAIKTLQRHVYVYARALMGLEKN